MLEFDVVDKYIKQDMSSDEFLRAIRRLHTIYKIEDYTFVILGQIGPTGKTWLCKQLKNLGLKAIEVSNSVVMHVEYNDDKNHYIVDEEEKCIVCVLNRVIRARF